MCGRGRPTGTRNRCLLLESIDLRERGSPGGLPFGMERANSKAWLYANCMRTQREIGVSSVIRKHPKPNICQEKRIGGYC